MMATNPQQQLSLGGPMSVQEYHQLEKRMTDAKYEYLDGVARLMSGGSGEHDQIAYNVRAALSQHFQSGPCFVRGSDMQVLVGAQSSGKENYVYPDVTISCDVADRRRGNTLIRSPRIVVEVLSPSTEKIDRGRKLEAYKRSSSMQEIVLINQFVQAIEVYRRDEQDAMIWHSVFYGPGSDIELKSIDMHLALHEIYQGIDFDEPLVGE
jgi:Uma2 family endonuclease